MTRGETQDPLGDPKAITLPESIDTTSDTVDKQTEGWKEDHQKERGALQLKLLALDLTLRRRYAGWLFLLLVVWLVGIYGLLIWMGLRGPLSDAVLIAALGTTTANVIGLFIVVARYIFPNRELGE
ncbi:MAG: hypothetical protein SX243_19635 [Acidobacteriota bacterium]|nr:hypothetical protein [Acidobacteriota bacterium]